MSPNYCINKLLDTSVSMSVVNNRDRGMASVIWERKNPGTKWGEPVMILTTDTASNIRAARTAFNALFESTSRSPIALVTALRQHGGRQLTKTEEGRYEYAFLGEKAGFCAVAVLGDKVLASSMVFATEADAAADLARKIDRSAMSWDAQQLIAWLQKGKPTIIRKVEPTALISVESLKNPNEAIPEVIAKPKPDLTPEEKAARKAARLEKKAKKAEKAGKKIEKKTEKTDK